MDIGHVLKDHAYQNIPLTFEEAYALGMYALQGCGGDELAQHQSISALCALHNRATYGWQWSSALERHHRHQLPRNAAEQIAGVCAAVFEHDIAESPSGFLTPHVAYAMDNCGMGGDLTVTANVSTISAFIAAAAGIPMCKHGSPANADAGRHGSSDFISMLGIDTMAAKDQVEAAIEMEGFGYTEALDVKYKRIHLQTHQVAKLPHMNDIIGPITNPLTPHLLTRRVVGVNHLISPQIVAEAYKVLNERGVTDLQHGIFVRGFADSEHYEGMDELSICEGGTQVAELWDGVIEERHLTAFDFGIDPIPYEDVSPPSGMSKGAFSLGILDGDIKGAPMEMVLANAALLFYLADRAQDMRECYALAEAVHQDGAAKRTALAVRERLPVIARVAKQVETIPRFGKAVGIKGLVDEPSLNVVKCGHNAPITRFGEVMVDEDETESSL
ncbi:MAG: Anthranilate phosphoribosyltransferase [Candidatus Nomurabacteria bacterium GW2011_GWA1_46_11]|uniref:Anthranilate phosphoribosyltransferase n=1 Tax=Candidatus Nomurabacteria bacterium GW2011_GWA1_46_11 TaxID=1618732 RepID=A0A0G1NNE9_9BACT|nr:MAG: Anthranilate phosphoribosyltransferase [Candidatus Nomurabacteria bacterium GW2011_GWA1_46_11]